MDVHDMNYEIAKACGGRLSDSTTHGVKAWHVEGMSPIKRFIESRLNMPEMLKFHENWEWLMAAVETIAGNEPIIGFLYRICGKYCNSIEDVHENLYLYTQKLKENGEVKLQTEIGSR